MERPAKRDGTVVALRQQQIWIEAGDGQLLRAWRPPDREPVCGGRLLVYLEAGEHVVGWHHLEAQLAVNQRYLNEGLRPVWPARRNPASA